MLDLHRHDEYSPFDGFGKAKELAELAKARGFTSLGLTNHGNMHGIVQHYLGCKDAGIKPILGVEAYFQPRIDRERKTYHLCLFAKNLKGYGNLNRLMFLGEKQKYYKPIITFADLEKYKEGIICSSACIAGIISKLIEKGSVEVAERMARRFKEIFEDDFYIEIQPYKIDDQGTQESINIELIGLAKKLKIKCILTSDSHYGSKEDFDTYLKMHEIGGTKYDIKASYGERHMPERWDLQKRFTRMHVNEFASLAETRKFAIEMTNNLEEIEEKVEEDILGQLPMVLPEFKEGQDSYKVLVENVKAGLKERGKYNKKNYVQRCQEELSVIKAHGYAEYFLIVEDYVKWAKNKGIEVGPGRGSVCNSLVAWALEITDVDSIKFDLDFRRFMREDKKKMPDIDLDFETSRRQEVIEYILQKYKGHSAQICSYGNYMIDGLLNDLAKVCGLSDETKAQELRDLKTYIRAHVSENHFDYEAVNGTNECHYYNKLYDNIVKHFSKMMKKVRYIGTHAAGVAITGGKLLDYCALKITSEGSMTTAFNLADLEIINVIKFDILGLNTCETIGELKRITGKSLDDSWFEDEKLYEQFRAGNCDGIFQFESGTAQSILQNIECDCFEDVVAASSMNRPGPLALRMPEQYAHNKLEGVTEDKFYEYTKATYGTLVYQEQLQQICLNVGGMSWNEADKVMKCLKNVGVEAVRIQVEKDKKELTEIFVKGAMKKGFAKDEAKEMFKKVLVYSFNKGHGVGYSIISLEEMYYKTYYPNEFWCIKLKHAKKEDFYKYSSNAVKDGSLLFIPHVNYSAKYSLRKVDGENIIQEGLMSIKGVGEKAAVFIEVERKAHGPFRSMDEFIERTRGKGTPVNKGVIEKLRENGALEFNKATYLSRVTKYNSVLYMKGMKK